MIIKEAVCGVQGLDFKQHTVALRTGEKGNMWQYLLCNKQYELGESKHKQIGKIMSEQFSSH